ncbi:MAG: sporulation protein YtfJ [Ruminococcaceae bacterium]|nr:sporulation protein YtfJ [Oscillospiraceae bacterium]
MENESSMKDIIQNALEQIRTVMDADTVIGQPIKLENGVTVIPVSKVLMGFASGGLDLPAKDKDSGKKNFGGGGGTGVTVFPIGFLTAYPDGRVEVLPMKQEPSTPIEQIADFINRTPDLVGRFKDLFAKKQEEKSEETAAE